MPVTRGNPLSKFNPLGTGMDAFFRGLLVVGALASIGAGYRTPNFIVTAPTAEFAKQVGDAAEIYRGELAIEWIGKPLPGNWSSPCPIDVKVGTMGAGGATYGVMQPLLNAQPRQVEVANRTLAKAQGLVAHFARFAHLARDGMTAQSYAALAGTQFDLVINATSAGLQDEMPSLPAGIFAAGGLAYDMVYGKHTPFMKFAQKHGARTADGLGMLVEQAAEAFFIWRGVRPETRDVLKTLRMQHP